MIPLIVSAFTVAACAITLAVIAVDGIREGEYPRHRRRPAGACPRRLHLPRRAAGTRTWAHAATATRISTLDPPRTLAPFPPDSEPAPVAEDPDAYLRHGHGYADTTGSFAAIIDDGGV